MLGGIDPNAPSIFLASGESRTVTVTVGKAEITGDIAGPEAEGACEVEALSVGADFAVAVPGAIEINTYTIAVPPGRWIVRAECESHASAFGPGDSPDLGDAQVVDLADGEVLSGVDLSPARTVDVSSYLLIRHNEASTGTPWCADYATPEGEIVDRRVERYGSRYYIATRLPWGDYRVRIWDCGQAGFEDRWYPYSQTFGGAATVTLPVGIFETIADALIQLVPDPDRVCNGLPATLVGTEERDRLYGTEGADVILALGGRDVVRGGDGRDTICGGDGRDVIFGGPKADTILGGTDRDRLKGGAGADVILGERGRDVVIGGFGDDILYGNGGITDLLDGRDGTDRCIDPAETTIRIDCEAD